VGKRQLKRCLLLVKMLCVATACLALGASAAPADTIIGGQGSGAGELEKQQGLGLDSPEGKLYVADTGNNRISVFDPSSGAFLFAFGWGVADGTSSELQTCTTTCFKGLEGNGAGQFERVTALAVDAASHTLYAVDRTNSRIEKFSSSGDFLFAIGKAGTGPGEFNLGDSGGIFVAVGPGGMLYAADQLGEGASEKTRVQTFEPDGSLIDELIIEVPGGAGNTTALAVDSAGNFYVGTDNRNGTGAVRKYDPAGVLLGTVNPSFNISALAVGPDDHLFVADSTGKSKILEFLPDLTLVRVFYGSLKERVSGLAADPNGIYASEDPGRVKYIPFPPPGPIVYPQPAATFATQIRSVKALLHAEINPEGAPTTYHFEYVDQESFEEDGFASAATKSTPESGSIGADFALHPATAEITGLTPDTIYHFRAVATNPAGTNPGPDATFQTNPPVSFGAIWSSGVGTDSATIHAEATSQDLPATAYFEYVDDSSYQASGFDDASQAPSVPVGMDAGQEEEVSASLTGLTGGTTYHYRLVVLSNCRASEPDFVCIDPGPEEIFSTLGPDVSEPCPNDVFRTGPAAQLLDCRGYEMVSPVDKEGSSVEVVLDILGYAAELNQGAADGQSITYSAYRAFADPESAPYSSQYMSRRTSAGWQNESISPPRGHSLYSIEGLQYQFKGFSADLCSGWPLQDTDVLLAPNAVEGFPNLYRRDNCAPGAGEYEAVTTVEPPVVEPSAFVPELQGFSLDESKVFFAAPDALTPNALEDTTQVYEASGGALTLVCLLPDNQTVPEYGCLAGGPSSAGAQRNANLDHAVSDDGSRVFWTALNAPSSAGAKPTPGPGKLYVRIGGSETVAISSETAAFQTAAADGSKAIYTVDDKLYEFDVASKTPNLIATGVKGVAGASDDASKIYFASTKALAPGAEEGKPNLYLSESGTETLIAILSSEDVGTVFSPVSKTPSRRTSRITPDGNRIVFMSTASLTGYDNTDAVSGKADAEVFLYDATASGGAGELTCVSCNPTNARPAGRELELKGTVDLWAAASIPVWQTELYAPRVISDDGSRVFFNSFERLVATDTNGKQDVYEWEAVGAGNCSQQSDFYVSSSDGCLSLISSGQGTQDSMLADSSQTGDDVFFKTAVSIVPQDWGRVDIYDARVGGGFAPPPPPPAECQGEACLGPVTPPPAVSNAISLTPGPGNPTTTNRKPRRCPKGKRKVKVKGKVRCVKKGSRQKRDGRSGRGTGR
jgi:hypothetical protein